jgi:hypothetical protein
LILILAAAGAEKRRLLEPAALQPPPRSVHQQALNLHAAVTACLGDIDTEDGDVATALHSGIYCRGGGISALIPAGYHPFGYKITKLGESFLEFQGSLDSDVGRFLASLKSRKKLSELKSQWLEILRVSKTAQTMRIYRTLDDLIAFCITARLLD